MNYPNYVLKDFITKVEQRHTEAKEHEDMIFFGELLSCLNDVEADLEDNYNQINDLENENSSLEDTIYSLEKENEELCEEIDDLENDTDM